MTYIDHVSFSIVLGLRVAFWKRWLADLSTLGDYYALDPRPMWRLPIDV